MRKASFLEGQGYICDNCNLYNDILSSHCKDCNVCRSEVLSLSAVVIREQRGINATIEYINMTDKSNLDKFSRFFNSGKILYSSMTYEKRLEWKEELKEILMTARANLSAADKVDEEEGKDLSSNARKWLVSNDENTGSDALVQPKIRQARMSKADKLKEQMLSLGLDMADVRGILGKVEKTAKASDMNGLVFKKSETKIQTSELCRVERHSECIGRYANENGSHECNCECHKVSVSTEQEIDKPDEPKSAVFNIGQLKFGDS